MAKVLRNRRARQIQIHSEGFRGSLRLTPTFALLHRCPGVGRTYMDRHPLLSQSFGPMRLILAVAVLGLACSSQKSAKYNPATDSPVQEGPVAQPLPAPPQLGPDQSMARVTGCSDSASPSEQDTVAYPPLVPGSRRPSATEVQ